MSRSDDGAIRDAGELLVAELSGLLHIEEQLARRHLPELAEETRQSDLRRALGLHLEQTVGHAATLERILELVGARRSPATDPALDGIVARHDRLARLVETESLLDLLVARTGADLERLEIASYRSVLRLAKPLGELAVARPLEQSLHDEEVTLTELEALAARFAEAAADR